MSPAGARLIAVSDVVIVGAGAIGVSTATHLARMGHRVLIVEKEAEPGLHQSLRNSGVIHAGYNLKPGSEKARLCVEGSRRLRSFCQARGIPMRQGGILVIARTEPECETLTELQRRAAANGVQARLVDESEIEKIEPHAQGMQALHAPEGASFDAQRYVQALVADAVSQRAQFFYGARVLGIDDPSLNGKTATHVIVRTSLGKIAGEVVINCAGLYADRLAGALAQDLRIVPFRGIYAELTPQRRDWVVSHVYPAPDLSFPFLGVHLSRRVDGRVLVGPGAMLAFGREAYHLTQVHWRDFADIFTWPGFYRLLSRPEFLRLIGDEALKSVSLKRVCAAAARLIPKLESSDLVWSFAGNRAQLVSRTGQLVDDVLVRETPRVIHVLNAVSPGLTSSLPFGEELAIRSSAKLRGLPSHTERGAASSPHPRC